MPVQYLLPYVHIFLSLLVLIGVARGCMCTLQAEEKIGGGANLQGKVASAPPGRARVQLFQKLGDLDGGSG